jgi:hypothetical protein
VFRNKKPPTPAKAATAMIVAPENGMDRKNRRSINGSSRRGSKTSRPTNDPRASVKATMICPDVQP